MLQYQDGGRTTLTLTKIIRFGTVLKTIRRFKRFLTITYQSKSMPTKRKGFDFWKNGLNKAKFVVAPMVDQSELAWRMLSRRYGAQLCYSPMLHASIFVRDAGYRRDMLQTCEEDRPLIVQFCAHDPETFVQAALLAECQCDAIDLNLGCPQSIAKRGHYGAFLQDEWELLAKMVSLAHEKLSVPITCKIRVFEDIPKTVEYAKMLEAAGCQLLTVHGRTREQKRAMTGLASWEHIKAVRENVSIPVFANGNIQYLKDVERCLLHTGVNGVMTAEGNLTNPALFTGHQPMAWKMANEYLELVDQYPCPLSYVRGHLFKLCHHSLSKHIDVRARMGDAKTLLEVKRCSKELEERAKKDMETNASVPDGASVVPYWRCQPYVRPSPTDLSSKRALEENGGSNVNPSEKIRKLSKKQERKAYKKQKAQSKAERQWVICSADCCENPTALKCQFNLCRDCCRQKTSSETLDCPGHRMWFMSKFKRKKANEESTIPTQVTETESPSREVISTS